jgi:hypothetical protein
MVCGDDGDRVKLRHAVTGEVFEAENEDEEE